jgi:predicted RNA binding protein with dsRBD fold (UPF0201 family)
MSTGLKKRVSFEIVSKEPNLGIIKIKLKFEEPEKLSVGKTMDYVSIQTVDPVIIQTSKYQAILDPGLKQ